MNRRSFLKGSAAVAATAVAAPVLPMIEELVVYGRSPAMDALRDIKFLEGLSQQMASTILYGNDEYMPTRFTGFTPRYDSANA